MKSTAGVAIAVTLVVILVGLAGYSLWSSFGQSDIAAQVNSKPFVDAESKKGFQHTPVFGETIPIKSPFSGKNTGYPAELCFWTKDGKETSTPTYVLMEQAQGRSGPTFCPDCGRLVILFNPRPTPALKVPPTKDEYEAKRGSAPAREE